MSETIVAPTDSQLAYIEAKYTGPDPRDDEREPDGGADDGDRHPEA